MFLDRQQAGAQLATHLSGLRALPDRLVLALPRGGVPVARPVADALEAELDILLVRKLGVPGQPELAMGAVALGGTRVLNDELIEDLRLPASTIEAVTHQVEADLANRAFAYRGTALPPRVAGRPVVVVDDGIATGATMRVSVLALREQGAASITVATPVAPPTAVRVLESVADAVICVALPDPFLAVGRWYQDFAQVTDEEVKALLANKSPRRAAANVDLGAQQ